MHSKKILRSILLCASTRSIVAGVPRRSSPFQRSPSGFHAWAVVTQTLPSCDRDIVDASFHIELLFGNMIKIALEDGLE